MTLSTATILNLALVIGTAMVAATLLLLYARGLQKDFPWFVAYLWLVLGRVPVLYLLRPYEAGYFYGYWFAEAITVGLSLLVIFEIYRHVLATSSFSLTRSGFFLLTVALLALAAVAAFFLEPADTGALVRAVLVLTQTVRIIQIGLLAVLLVASLFFNFYWQSLPFGFALGYGLYATLELVATTFRSSLGPSGDVIFAITKVWGYQIAVLAWIIFIVRHRQAHALKAMPPESVSQWLHPMERVAK